MTSAAPYDEFGLLGDNAAEAGLRFPGPPAVRRQSFTVATGQSVSAIRWGTAEPELVLLHGGGQNAHTWDTVALALGRPLVAIDLPNHGHSDGGREGSFGPLAAAGELAVVNDALAPTAKALVGMSLGGLTSISLADERPDLVRSLVLVDVTPGVDED